MITLYGQLAINQRSGGLLGYMDITYDDLVAEFGRPTRTSSPDGKTDCEWIIRMDNGKQVRIYVYKTQVAPKDATNWHVGGDDDTVLWKLAENGIGSNHITWKTAPKPFLQ